MNVSVKYYFFNEYSVHFVKREHNQFRYIRIFIPLLCVCVSEFKAATHVQ